MQELGFKIVFGFWFFFWVNAVILEMAARKAGVLALFDVDGTLTAPRKVLELFIRFSNLMFLHLIPRLVK